jgi:hypothetical protein
VELKSIAETTRDVMLAVYEDRDRSVQRAVELAIAAGIAHERERIAAILKLSVPPGLEKALVMVALHPGITADNAAEIISKLPTDHAAKLRTGFRLVRDNSKQT